MSSHVVDFNARNKSLTAKFLLVYKFKNIFGRADFSDQFRKIIVRYQRIGYKFSLIYQWKVKR